MTDREIYEKLVEWTDQGLPVCLATIIETQGSTPRQVGAKMLIFADGTTYGSIGAVVGKTWYEARLFAVC